LSVFKLPDLGEGLVDAKILEWHAKELDHIKVDEPLVSVETAKAVIEIPSPETGIIKKIYGAIGENIKVNSELVMFEQQESEATQSPKNITIKAMPAARKLASKHNISLADINPANNVSITTADVEKYIASIDNNRKAMSYNMQQAYNSVVPATIHEDINLRLWQEPIDITARVIEAIAYALTKNPKLNSTFCNTTNNLIACKELNIGLAIQKESGLYVPNIALEAGNSNVSEIRSQINHIKEAQAIKPNQTKHSVIYSNIGSIAGQYSNPILVPPAIIIVATGRVRKKVVAIANEIMICPIMPISVTFDHRAITGAEAATFIKCFEQDLILNTSILNLTPMLLS
jgi:2-oxoisovalerate dehydrogenase E2 component (dihydrolipoyl transacylase)